MNIFEELVSLLIEKQMTIASAESCTGGLFASHILSVANRQRSDEDATINYIQSEFVKRGIAVPASLPRRISDFNDVAETLVMDLLEKESE